MPQQRLPGFTPGMPGNRTVGDGSTGETMTVVLPAGRGMGMTLVCPAIWNIAVVQGGGRGRFFFWEHKGIQFQRGADNMHFFCTTTLSDCWAQTEKIKFEI